jgi:ABC-type uncharacterized transport system involved in gliding motility auxiliary subunit
VAAKQTTRAAGESIAFLAIMGAVLVVLNILATNFNPGRFDLTRNHRYSLSPGSENVVSDLDDTVTIRVYFTDNLPEEFAGTERQVRDLLSEYRAASHGKLNVRYIRPDNAERQQQAETDGVQKVQHTVLRNDARQQVDGYRGLAIEYRGETKAIPVIEGSEGLEYRLTTLIREMTSPKLKIGVVTGHGATATTGGFARISPHLPSYEFVDVDATQPVAEDIRALIIAGPDSTITEPELRNIDNYVMRGGSLGIFGGNVKLPGEQGGPTVETVDSGVNRLIDHWGVHMDTNVLADARCVPRQGQDGRQELYPVWAVVMFEEAAHTHPAAYQLNETLLAYSSTLTVRRAPANVHVTVLARSSEQSWKLTGSPIPVEPEGGQWRPSQPFGPFPLLVAIEGRLPSAFAATASTDASSEAAPAGPAQAARPVRVLVAGSSSLLSETFVPPAEAFENPQMGERARAIIAFTLNSIDWLANDSDLIAIRAKTLDAPMLDIQHDLETEAAAAGAGLDPRDRAGIERARTRIESMQAKFERKKSFYKWGMFIALPLVVLLIGAVHWAMRRRHKASLAR